MIRGYLSGPKGRPRPFVVAELVIPVPTDPDVDIVGAVHFLIDTGADSTLLAPHDAQTLGVRPKDYRPAEHVTGIGGTIPTIKTPCTLTFPTLTLSPITLRILTPATPQQEQGLRFVPSLLGRDVLKQFALFLEERTARVLLLTADEAARLDLAALSEEEALAA